MDHTLVNLNQLRSYGMIVQDNPFTEAPIFIPTEHHDFMPPLSSKETILGVTTRTPTYKELQTCLYVTCSLVHEWDPHIVFFPNSSRTVEEEISRNIGAVMKEEGPLTSLTQIVTAIKWKKYMTSAPCQVECLEVSKLLQYHQGIHQK